jgi:hypothetical protein
MVAVTCNPSTWEVEAGGLKVKSTWATSQDPISKKKKKKKKTKEKTDFNNNMSGPGLVTEIVF